jgi:hypothetical protein
MQNSLLMYGTNVSQMARLEVVILLIVVGVNTGYSEDASGAAGRFSKSNATHKRR